MMPICIQADDPAFGRVPRAAAVWFRRVPVSNPLSGGHKQVLHGWQEESDSVASWKDAAHPPAAGTRKVYT
jgi:hypothetical protein